MDLDRLKIKTPGLIPVRYWNDLIDAVKSSLITSFVGGAYARTGVGTALWARGGGEVESSILPLQIITSAEGSGESAASYISLHPGTVGGVIPKIGGVALTATPAPKMTYSAGSDTIVWIECAAAAGKLTSAEVHCGSNLPEDSDSTAVVRIGSVMADGSIMQEKYGPIEYVMAYSIFETGRTYQHILWSNTQVTIGTYVINQ